MAESRPQETRARVNVRKHNGGDTRVQQYQSAGHATAVTRPHRSILGGEYPVDLHEKRQELVVVGKRPIPSMTGDFFPQCRNVPRRIAHKINLQ